MDNYVLEHTVVRIGDARRYLSDVLHLNFECSLVDCYYLARDAFPLSISFPVFNDVS